MNNIAIFSNDEFGQVRTLEQEGRVLFLGADIAKILGYSNPHDALIRHCKEDGLVFHEVIDSIGRRQQAKFINEGNMYRLIVNSKLPSAERFEKWVYDEVLPSVRQHGAYMTAETIEKALTDPDTIIKIATKLKEEQAKRMLLEAKVEEQKPKVIFADAVATSNSSILVGELAKLLKQNGVDMGQNRLFTWLRNNGYLIRRNGTDFNMPTQYSMDLGLFEIKETVVHKPDGSSKINKTPKVTGKGSQYFINKFIQAKAQ